MTDEIEGIFKSTKTLITDYLMSEVGEILLPLLYLFIDFFFSERHAYFFMDSESNTKDMLLM